MPFRHAEIRRKDGGRHGASTAGIYELAPLAASDPAKVRRQFDTNVIGLVAITQALLAKLVEARGTIVT